MPLEENTKATNGKATLDEVRALLQQGGEITAENIVSSERCRGCDKGRWEQKYSFGFGGLMNLHYTCENHECSIISTAIFTIAYS